jgi:hypothetical protein
MATAIAEQRENLMHETEEGVPRDVRPISGNEQRRANREDDQSRADQYQRTDSGEIVQRNSSQPNNPSDVTIQASPTPDATSGSHPDSFEAQSGRRANNAADQSEQAGSENLALFSEFEINDLRSRWSTVQAGFVDAPRRSVEQADELVAAVMQRISDGFAQERSTLERQWDRGDSISTEDLRLALQRYRVFFGRLLNAA